MKFAILQPMNLRKYLFILLAVSPSLKAQIINDIKFDEVIYDFGKIKEESLEVSHLFKFTNVSTKSLVVTKVTTSCGCTQPEWSTDTVPPGASGFIRAIYSTEGKNGDFHKYLYVYINRPDYFATISIKGHVIPRPRPDYEKSTFRLNYGNMAFSENVANIGVILNSETKEKTIRVFNYNEYPIRILKIDQKPDFVEVIMKDSVVDAGDSINITVRVLGNKITQVGDAYNRISLQTDDPAFPQKFLFVQTKMKEDFSKFSKKDLKKAPKLKLSKGPTIDLGKRKLGSKFTESVTITNEGKSDLIIRKMQPACSCITLNMSSATIKPGQSVTIVFTYDSINQPIANLNKLVSVICNDPSQPEFNFNFKITITK